MAQAERVINNIFSWGGKVAPLAEDISYIGSDESMEHEIFKSNMAHLGLALAGPILQALGTWGIFNIGNSELPKWSGEAAYLGSRVGDGTVLSVLGKITSLASYEHVFTDFRNKFLDIPPEIRLKLKEYLVEQGIPSNNAGEYAVTNAVYNLGEMGHVPEMIGVLATPILQILAVGDEVPWAIKAGLLAFSYSGLVVGPKLNENNVSREFEWNTVSRALADSRETSGAGGNLRNLVATKWWKHVIGRYLKSYGAENGTRGLVDLAAGLAPFFKQSNLFGWVSMIQGIGIGGFVRTLDITAGLGEKKIKAKIISLARAFCENGVFLPVERSWDNFRLAKLANIETKQSEAQLTKDVICYFEKFVPDLGEKSPMQISGKLRRGKCHMLNGRSGDGKSLFLYALRGLAKSNGNVTFNDLDGERKSIYSYSQAELSEKIMYFTPDRRSDGSRVVDEYADAYVDSIRADYVNLPVAVQRALIVPDSLLERRIKHLESGIAQDSNDWENDLLSELSDDELGLVKLLRRNRLDFAKSRLLNLGINLNLIEADRKLSEVSSGMKERIYLDGSTLYFLDRGPSVMVLDEAFRMVDVKTAKELMQEICKRMLEIEPDKRPALVLVTNVHKSEISKVVKTMLGKQGMIKMSVAKVNDGN